MKENERLAEIEREYESVLQKLSEPDAASDRKAFLELGRRHKNLLHAFTAALLHRVTSSPAHAYSQSNPGTRAHSVIWHGDGERRPSPAPSSANLADTTGREVTVNVAGVVGVEPRRS